MSGLKAARVPTWQLRAAFAQSLSELYGREVPAYKTLLAVTAEINQAVVGRLGATAERLGSIDRVTAERHGAIRVGSAVELAQAARIFGAFGMYPVGYYDLRDAAGAVPVVSTAFRPTDPDELARNPFRVFTSVLAVEDERFFDSPLRAELAECLRGRVLFSPTLLGLADRAEAEGGLEQNSAREFVTAATASLALSQEPVDRSWYDRLSQVSAVAADIGGVASTHINHLTPRVLDIDALHQTMTARGTEMIPEIQGPPRWAGPPVLLRQTSFRALAEDRAFVEADGSLSRGALRVRFGEVEHRGLALTPAGRDRYDALMNQIDDLRRNEPEMDPLQTQLAAAALFDAGLPHSEEEFAAQGLAYFSYATGPAETLPPQGFAPTLDSLIESGVLVRTPLVYEDFLPRSAAGIFASNLAESSTLDASRAAARYDWAWLEGALNRPLHDAMSLYAAQESHTLQHAIGQAGVPPGFSYENGPGHSRHDTANRTDQSNT